MRNINNAKTLKCKKTDMCSKTKNRRKSSVIAKFHYTGPTGHDQTKSADFVRDPQSPLGQRGSPTKSADFVRSGLVGSCRARLVEFSYKTAKQHNAREFFMNFALARSIALLLVCLVNIQRQCRPL